MSLAVWNNPEIFFELKCTWNVQLWDRARYEDCVTIWSAGLISDAPRPQLIHANGQGKQDGKFSLEKPGLVRDGELSFQILYTLLV